MNDLEKKAINLNYSNIIEAFDQWIKNEYGNDNYVEINDDGLIPVAYTTYSFDDFEEENNIEHEINVYYDVINKRYRNVIDDRHFSIDDRRSWSNEEIISELKHCGFDDMIFSCVHLGFRLAEEGVFKAERDNSILTPLNADELAKKITEYQEELDPYGFYEANNSYDISVFEYNLHAALNNDFESIKDELIDYIIGGDNEDFIQKAINILKDIDNYSNNFKGKEL